jgi:adenosyl cobinamide kinase/adenosyl cobinamide phosphate guanylyltransferase
MIVLMLGGTRSGKSALAERRAAQLGDTVTFIAPCATPSTDDDLIARIAAHRARRPSTWGTVECGDALPEALRRAPGVALVDSLGTWVANAPELVVDVPALVEALEERTAPTVLVGEEVGLAIHAPTRIGRDFTDRLGELNTAVAAIADEVLLVVAGRVLRLEQPDALGLG